EKQQIYLDYWRDLARYLEAQGGDLRVPVRPQAGNWFQLGRLNWLCILLGTGTKKPLRVGLEGADEDSWKRLRSAREAIDKESLEPLAWEDAGEENNAFAGLYLQGADPKDRADWPRQHAWLSRNLKRLYEVFARRIENVGMVMV